MSRFSCAEYILVDIETNDLEFILICTNLGKFRITTILFSAILSPCTRTHCCTHWCTAAWVWTCRPEPLGEPSNDRWWSSFLHTLMITMIIIIPIIYFLTWTHCCLGTETQTCLGTLWHKFEQSWLRRPGNVNDNDSDNDNDDLETWGNGGTLLSRDIRTLLSVTITTSALAPKGDSLGILWEVLGG